MRGIVQPIRGGMGVQSGYGQMNQIGSNVAGGFEEVVNVPNSLSEFASRPQFQQILLKVKQQTSINYIDLKKDTATLTVISITINAPTAETATNARRLVETHFKNQIKIMSAEAKLAKTQTELFSAQGEVASGMMVDFFVPVPVIGLVIGKGGGRIKEIEKETGVSSINVDGHTGKIMVVGPDAGSVQSARELLELQEEEFPLSKGQADWLANDRINNSLSEIRSDNNLNAARVDRDAAVLSVIGTVPAIQSMKAMLSVQLEYIDKAIEIQSTERLAREQLRDFKREHGFRGADREYYDRRDGGDRSRGGRSNVTPTKKHTPAEKAAASSGGRDDKKTPVAPASASAPVDKASKSKGGTTKSQTVSMTGLPPPPHAAKPAGAAGGKAAKKDNESAPAATKDKAPAKKEKEPAAADMSVPTIDPQDSKRRRGNKKQGKAEATETKPEATETKPKATETKPKAAETKPKADKAEKKPAADKANNKGNTEPVAAAGGGASAEEGGVKKNNNKKKGGAQKDKTEGDAAVEAVTTKTADMSLQDKEQGKGPKKGNKRVTKDKKEGGDKEKDGTDKPGKSAGAAKEKDGTDKPGKSAGAAKEKDGKAEMSAADKVGAHVGATKVSSVGDDGHDVVNIAPLYKRDRRARNKAKRLAAEGAPEVTTSST